jgi:hypothetical protein
VESTGIVNGPVKTESTAVESLLIWTVRMHEPFGRIWVVVVISRHPVSAATARIAHNRP